MPEFTVTPPFGDSSTLLVLAVCQNKALYGLTALNGVTAEATGYAEFNGEKDEQLVLYQPHHPVAPRILLMGLGAENTLQIEDWRQFSGKAVGFGRTRKVKRLCLAAPTASGLSLEVEEVLRAMLEGAELANYTYDRYKAPREKPLESISIWLEQEVAERFRTLPKRVTTICAGTCLARDWVNLAPNHKSPANMADTMAQVAQKAGLQVTIWDETELARQQFNALLAVGGGSSQPPRLVQLVHASRTDTPPIVLVGKGVTFDSGGINLKSQDGLKNMKMDLAGAAAVAATLITAAHLELKLHLMGVIPLVENMPSGRAMRPGDVVRSRSGKTIEIKNTDAEGRLILADTLSYVVQTFKPRLVIDLATLTGACMVALGEKIAGLFATDEALSQHLIQAATLTHERCWPLPLPPDYQELLKSDLADMANSSDQRWGGAITAALFLKEFITATPWAHLDIAGPAYATKDSPWIPAGGSGFGVRLLIQYLIQQHLNTEARPKVPLNVI